MTIKPDAILMDEAFKTIYAGETIDFRNIKKQDLPALLKAIGDNANQRLSAPMVQDVLIQELNYVPKAEARMPPPLLSISALGGIEDSQISCVLIQHAGWWKGGQHAWRSLIPMTCACASPRR